MAVFKCKMCGGTLEIQPGESVATCDSCGSKQTIPNLSDDRKANLFDRANHFRRANEFDKAMNLYEQILNEDNSDAEAHWGVVLCRYGIEYVEDPATHKRMPTVNRAQFSSVFADEDYKAAMQYADGYQRDVYEAEAKAIEEIQKGILAISQKEEPFDVFISFKETDANGRRTPDAVLANELYHQLTQEGFKVFFAPITLEDKLGSEYEPYIFAALNSSKAMVVLGTKPEYFNAVWVKNEWSRYLALIKNGAKKTLIPAFKDMDPYDLPEEFSHLMAQDMSKLGFMQDLIRGIKKIISVDVPKTNVKETVIVNTNNVTTAPLLERVFLFLEDGKWQDADIYCEKVLDIDPKNAEAYLGKLMAELRVNSRRQLADCEVPFDNSDNYSKVIRFSNEALEAEIRGYIAHINDRNENARLTGIYNRAVSAMQTANTEAEYKSVANAFATIPGFKDADTLAQQCLNKAEVCRKDAIYDKASKTIGTANWSFRDDAKIQTYKEAIDILKSISGWKDVDEQIYYCYQKIDEIKAKEEAERLEAKRKVEAQRIAAEQAKQKRIKLIKIISPIVAACIVLLILVTKVIVPNVKYNAALSMLADGKIIDAYESLIAFNGYRDSTQKAAEIYDQYKAEKLKVADVGDILFFGAYEQDNNTSNGKEDIEWLVLAKENGKALVISKYALDCQPYNTELENVTWESCSLRKWLNSTFLNNAFDAKEKAMIQDPKVFADKNPDYNTDPDNATTDKVFLLSINEAKQYFSGDEARKCTPTEYAIANGDCINDSGNCFWWLRSPGNDQDCAADVGRDGSVYYYGLVDFDNFCVRPALWINLDS